MTHDFSDSVAAIVNGRSITLGELIRRARWADQLQFLNEAIDAEILEGAARERDIEVTREEIQKAASEFRTRHKLFRADDMNRWLDEHGLTSGEWGGLPCATTPRSQVQEASVWREGRPALC